jgi:coenzyme F420 hydrogenase subunit beta
MTMPNSIVESLGENRMDATHSRFRADEYRDVAGIERIVKEGLCHRCGACVGFCPAGTYVTGKLGYPEAVNPCIHCNICVDVCSGVGVDYPQLGKQMFGDQYTFGDARKQVRSAYIASAGELSIRRRGASGGVVTGLLIHWLRTGRIKGAVVVVEDPDDPAKGKGIVARTVDELLDSAQSRYTTSPSLAALQDIQREDGPFALVGLPCQIHSLRKRQLRDPRWQQRIPITIGLLCHYNLPCEGSHLAGRVLTPKGRSIEHVKYRQRDERGWPHNSIEMTFDDGSKWRSPYGPAQAFNIVSRVAPLGRCLSCLDATAEFADLSVADPWIRNEQGTWKYHDDSGDGVSSVLSRTAQGEALMQDAQESGALNVQTIPAQEVFDGQHAMILEKRERVAWRLRMKKRFGRPTPNYPMELPPTSPAQLKKELAFLTTRIIPMIPFLPALLVRLAFSPLGAYFINRRIRKREALARTGKAKYSTSDFGDSKES